MCINYSNMFMNNMGFGSMGCGSYTSGIPAWTHLFDGVPGVNTIYNFGGGYSYNSCNQNYTDGNILGYSLINALSYVGGVLFTNHQVKKAAKAAEPTLEQQKTTLVSDITSQQSIIVKEQEKIDSANEVLENKTSKDWNDKIKGDNGLKKALEDAKTAESNAENDLKNAADVDKSAKKTEYDKAVDKRKMLEKELEEAQKNYEKASKAEKDKENAEKKIEAAQKKIDELKKELNAVDEQIKANKKAAKDAAEAKALDKADGSFINRKSSKFKIGDKSVEFENKKDQKKYTINDMTNSDWRGLINAYRNAKDVEDKQKIQAFIQNNANSLNHDAKLDKTVKQGLAIISKANLK